LAENVTQFEPGDDIFGIGHGGFASMQCAGEEPIWRLKPAYLSFEGSGCRACYGRALTALCTASSGQKVAIQPGQKVLINGAIAAAWERLRCRLPNHSGLKSRPYAAPVKNGHGADDWRGPGH